MGSNIWVIWLGCLGLVFLFGAIIYGALRRVGYLYIFESGNPGRRRAVQGNLSVELFDPRRQQWIAIGPSGERHEGLLRVYAPRRVNGARDAKVFNGEFVYTKEPLPTERQMPDLVINS